VPDTTDPTDFSPEQEEVEASMASIVVLLRNVQEDVQRANLGDVVFPARLHQNLRQFREQTNQWIPAWLGEAD
jgi:hypothetical protein